MNRRLEIVMLTLISVALVAAFLRLNHNRQDVLDEADRNLAGGTALVLDHHTSPAKLKALLLDGGYCDDNADAAFIAEHITARLNDGATLPNLGALNMPPFTLKAATARAEGGRRLKERVSLLDERMGLTPEVRDLYSHGIPDSLSRSEGEATITVVVTRPDSTLHGLSKAIARLAGRHVKPVEGVAVRLKEHAIDTAMTARAGGDSVATYTARERVVGYAMTDAHGRATFHVPAGYYSVLPIKENCNYGAARGTRSTALSRSATYRFSERELTLTPLSSETYRQVKAHRALLVRTPSQYRHAMTTAVVIFLLAWWMAYLIISYVDRRLRRKSDHLVLLLLMTITAVGTVTMFAIALPLTDRLLGSSSTTGVALGVTALVLCSGLNVAAFHNGYSRLQAGVWKFDFVLQIVRWMARPFHDKLAALRIKSGRRVTAWAVVRYYLGLAGAVLCLPVSALNRLRRRVFKQPWRVPEGTGYLLLAMLLTVLLYLLGTGPEGSDARVNLFGFQPSELSKLLVVVFIAAFFARNAARIHAFSSHADAESLKLQVRTLGGVIAGMALLLGMYAVLLSDMGPALVLIITFIMLYSLARRDFMQLVAGVVSFGAMLWIGHLINPSTGSTMLLMAAAWFVAWIAGWWLLRHRLSESAVFFNLLLVAFLLGGDLMMWLGQEALGQRLANRTAMVGSGAWNNDIAGGDQVAQGIWSLATGGWSGQGLGHGNANLVPAFNTDMIFTSTGEVMGCSMLVLLLICFVILLRHSFKQAYRAGNPFAFYLAAGVALVTGVQFFVIVLGSLGAIPLTGVAVPLLSYGASSLVINLAAFGLIIAVSRDEATAAQRKERGKYGNVTAAAIGTFIVLGVVVTGYLLHYQVVNRDRYLVKPALVTNLNGDRFVEYNPRIMLLASRLNMGDVTDRNGLLLATDNRDTLMARAGDYARLGIDTDSLRHIAARAVNRYYPLGDHLFFMLGDMNTLTLWTNDEENNPHGYMADLRHLSQLRGYDNRGDEGMTVEHLVTDKHHLSPFLPPTRHESDALVRDYSALLPLLKAGLHSDEVKKWNERRAERDLQLALDASLQVNLQNAMATTIKASASYNIHKHLRASVVVLDAARGDLLASACYPLPSQATIENMAENGITYYTERALDQAPYTERDLGTTYFTFPGSTAKVISAMAGLMQGGEAAHEELDIKAREAVHRGEPSGLVDMARAIRESSNCYFVHLVNRHNLYDKLGTVYSAAGLRLHERGRQSLTPYYFDCRYQDSTRRERFMQEINYLGHRGRETYNYRMERRAHSDLTADWCMNWSPTAMAWGQGSLEASPLAMARVAAIVANDGRLATTRYVLRQGGEPVAVDSTVTVMPEGTAALLRRYMQAEADKHRVFNATGDNLLRIGGKTGTPERVYRWSRSGKNNDAWYVCFVYSRQLGHYVAVAVRLERTDGRLSGLAVDFMKDVVLPALVDGGYDPLWK